MIMPEKTKILFVCLGNICRSPTAHGIFEKLVEQNNLNDKFEIDSAGTAAYHIGKSPDPRSTMHAAKRGYDLTRQTARRVTFDDFYEFDHILAMDKNNYDDLIRLCPNEMKYKIRLMLEHGTMGIKEVPDPYHEGEAGFEKVLDLLEDACTNFLKKITQ